MQFNLSQFADLEKPLIEVAGGEAEDVEPLVFLGALPGPGERVLDRRPKARRFILKGGWYIRFKKTYSPATDVADMWRDPRVK